MSRCAVEEEGQLLLAAEEGTEKSVQCVRHGQWLVPGSPASSLLLRPFAAAARGIWREEGRRGGGGGGKEEEEEEEKNNRGK